MLCRGGDSRAQGDVNEIVYSRIQHLVLILYIDDLEISIAHVIKDFYASKFLNSKYLQHNTKQTVHALYCWWDLYYWDRNMQWIL